MRESVREAFLPFTVPLEGVISHLYQDVLGLVSVAIGNLVDPIDLALGLPFVHIADGRPATRAEIAEEWHRIKALGSGDYKQGNPAAAGGWRYAKPHARLHLTPAGVEDVVLAKFTQNDATLRKHFPAFEEWPADAQLATHSMAWGVGANLPGPYPKMSAALRAKDFRTAAAECMMRARVDGKMVELNGLKPRNRANRVLYLNAAMVEELVLDPDPLRYPLDLTSDPPAPPSSAPPDAGPDTFPELPHPVGRFTEAIEASIDAYRREAHGLEPAPPIDDDA